MKVRVYTDGASRGNPGSAAVGVLIQDDNGNDIKTFRKYIGECTNNVAEYSALIESVKLLKELNEPLEEIIFFCDSELIVKQIRGEYKIRNKDLINLSLDFWKEIKSLNKKFSIRHIPREENRTADKLANEALDENKMNSVSADKSLLLD